MHTNQTVIQRAIQLILLISLAPVHTISIAKPSIKIDKAAKAHHHAGHKKTASKAKPKGSSNTHSHHPYSKAAHRSTPQQSRAKSVTAHQPATTNGGNRITAQQHGALTLMKADHLLLGPGGHNPAQPVEQRTYLQQKQEQQLTNIDLHAVNQGIDLLNKYYPGLGQVTFQPVQQLLPTNPLIARQWANVPQDFSQDQSFENDKFPDLNVQVESQVNSETQTDKINQQRATGDDTAIPLTDSHSWFGIGKYNDLYKNLIRFIVNPDDQYIGGPAQDQDPGRRMCAIQSCHLDARGARRIGEMEGFKGRPYYDQTGKYITEYKKGATIGWGHLIRDEEEFNKYKNGITKEEATKLKQHELIQYEEIVKEHINVPVTQDMYNALVSRAYNGGGRHAFKDQSNGSKFITDYINSGRELNFDNPDKDTKLFIAAYQRLDTTQHRYMRGVEYRRERELDMMKHDYTEHSTKEYQSRQLYGPGSKNIRWTRVFK